MNFYDAMKTKIAFHPINLHFEKKVFAESFSWSITLVVEENKLFYTRACSNTQVKH